MEVSGLRYNGVKGRVVGHGGRGFRGLGECRLGRGIPSSLAESCSEKLYVLR